MRRRLKGLLAVPLLGAALLMTGCWAETDPPTNVERNSATLHGTVSCNKGENWGKTEHGYWYFRWRPTFGPEFVGPWINGPVRNYNCFFTMAYLGMPGNSTGPVPVQQRADFDLPTDTFHYIYQLCGRTYYPMSDGSGEGDTGELCFSENAETNPPGETRPPFSGPTSQYDGFGAVYDPATDALQHVVETADGTILQPTQYGAGTNWFCSAYGVNKGAQNQGLRVWLARMFGSYCWGTGKLRGSFKDYLGVNARGETSFFGNAVGWEVDGVEGSAGPTVQNGKLSFMRNVGFHQCTPPQNFLPWPANLVCGLRRDWNMKLKLTLWVDNQNRPQRQFEGTLVM